MHDAVLARASKVAPRVRAFSPPGRPLPALGHGPPTAATHETFCTLRFVIDGDIVVLATVAA